MPDTQEGPPLSHADAGQDATVAEAWLRLLRMRGVDYLFGNAGTDFPSVIEAFARVDGDALPKPVLAPHENAAVGMAHGYAMVTGRPQAVMVHVSVGTANALAGIMNAARENVPMLVAAGRTPIFEDGVPGARSMPIHWAQEMFDQASIVREMVRWDYELRDARQVVTVVDRALAIANSAPRGPVYLSLPREVLAEPADPRPMPPAPRMTAATGGAPDAAALEAAADLLAGAQNPLVIATRSGIDPAAVEALAALAANHALPVVEYRARYLNLPASHPMHVGHELAPWIDEADAILVLDSDVPWLPGSEPPEDCRVIQIGPDPLFARYPIRGFASDVTIAAQPAAALRALDAVLAARPQAAGPEARRAKVAAHREALAKSREATLRRARAATPMGRAWISHCIVEAAGPEAIIVNEYPFLPEAAQLERPSSFFGSSSVSGLGWGLPAALGAQLAKPDRLVVATLGDGAYIFANPTACHQIAQAQRLPLLTVIFNNGEWGAVRRATSAMYPEGRSSRANALPFISLSPAPAYEMLVQASGGHGERVERAEDLPEALSRAIHVIRTERRQALVNVLCE